MLKEVILGLIQGITEFLPISSSGHLVIIQHYLDFSGPPLLFDVLLHLGTTGAVILIFAMDIKSIFLSLFKGVPLPKGRGSSWRVWFNDRDRRLALLVMIGTLPTAIIGLGGRSFFEGLFTDHKQAALMLLLTGSILCLAELIGKRGERRWVG